MPEVSRIEVSKHQALKPGEELTPAPVLSPEEADFPSMDFHQNIFQDPLPISPAPIFANFGPLFVFSCKSAQSCAEVM